MVSHGNVCAPEQHNAEWTELERNISVNRGTQGGQGRRQGVKGDVQGVPGDQWRHLMGPLMICKAQQVFLRFQWGQGTC